tara:strand:- start:161 stop:832 length:672 start_codon:yes stop_codon:yes gene_type:complete
MTDPYLEFDSNSDEFVQRVRKAEPLLFKIAEQGLNSMKEMWITTMKRDHFTGYYPGKTRGLRLRNRRGALKSSTGGRVTGKKVGDLKALLRIGGGSAGYAPTQEYGASISHMSGMRIPLKAALTRTGRVKAGAVPRRSGGVWKTSQFGRTFLFSAKDGKLFIAARPKYKPKAKHRGNVLLFMLVERVKIRPRLRATEEVIEIAGNKVDQISARFAKVLRMGGM